MIVDPKDFDAIFRRSVVAAIPEPAALQLGISIHCGQHPDQEMQPIAGNDWPTQPLSEPLDLRVACPECGLEAVLALHPVEESRT